MQLGDSFKWTPTAFAGELSASPDNNERRKVDRPVHGKIVYIHPQRRYFTAEANINGVLLRESFQFKPR